MLFFVSYLYMYFLFVKLHYYQGCYFCMFVLPHNSSGHLASTVA